LHNAGLDGTGILIGIMDTGFDTTHAAFTRLRSERLILHTRDFINDDSDVMDSLDIQRSHGTAVLSVLAGFDEGNLIGPAFGAHLALAKTEILPGEDQAEEDYWVAAAEWMESLGVDIISSSLGYIDWYDTTQLDGRTAVITLAADAAAALGVVVVNAAGNEGNTTWRKVIPPADGLSVIAVGGVDSDSNVIGFSSRGPTADGRIKPDVCALGAGNYVADYFGGYGFSSGTSFAAPLISGGIALLLQGHPDWTPDDVTQNLKRASSRAFGPDNAFGWGIPNFVRAYYGLPFEPEDRPSIEIIPQPAEDSVTFRILVPQASNIVFSIHEISGAEVIEWTRYVNEPSTVAIKWNGINHKGKRVASGIYICNLKTSDSNARGKFFFISRR